MTDDPVFASALARHIRVQATSEDVDPLEIAAELLLRPLPQFLAEVLAEALVELGSVEGVDSG